ncbi:uncharacterized protein MICPUCDRAFT_14447 [Micromonas pusilla CCMP1545]|uniref:Predicted protein n=1 Tax=Micromonas pusilla (strain CCMP1545) TaxID=564608 RepID=C1MJH0_MICPC|nr:uncharacterized protein MICPUCDRAFT_14447 [Micromonas pusilla CCMP1545]EEH59994.1 predicted protein [Micromonas pusilla CCMP1545]|eukprot:XP_003056618.1 predicted protein [Micromonas pusilla CCMP1545]
METAPPPPAASKLTLNDVVGYPRPGYDVPELYAFSPDDGLVTSLCAPERGTSSRNLYAFDTATGTTKLLCTPPPTRLHFEGDDESGYSAPEAMQRERARETGKGLTSYEWASSSHRADHRASPSGVQGGDLRLVARSAEGSPVLDAKISPDGKWVAFVRDDEIRVASCDANSCARVTYGAHNNPSVTHGLAEYIAAEEMRRDRGFWWRRDGGALAFCRVDVSAIPTVRIPCTLGAQRAGTRIVEEHAYPFTGGCNAYVRLGVVDVPFSGDPDDDPTAHDVTWMDVNCGPASLGGAGLEEEYLAAVDWSPRGDFLIAQIQSRDQKTMKVVRLDPTTGERATNPRDGGTCLHVERNDASWVSIHNMLYAPRDAVSGARYGDFIWASEKTGYMHLYYHDGVDGECAHAITGGEWCVDELIGVDEGRGFVYFTASKLGPLERHLYRARLFPTLDASCASASTTTSDAATSRPRVPRCRRLTRERGYHSVAMDHAGKRFLDVYDSVNNAPNAMLRMLPTDDDDDVCNGSSGGGRNLIPPSLVTVAAADGSTTLHGALYLPDEDPELASARNALRPGIVIVYGGPQAQEVQNTWRLTSDVRAQFYRQLGYVVFKLDNRGSSRRGHAFEAALKNAFGDVDVNDQIEGVRWLVNHARVDPDRVGVIGWSYGGFVAATCVLKAPGTFAAACAGAPVTRWELYDTHYTERFLGAPNKRRDDDPYARASVLSHVDGFARGKLLIVHGMLDENVHFSHSTALEDAIKAASARRTRELGEDAGTSGELTLLPFPTERHVMRRTHNRKTVESAMFRFFQDALMGEGGGWSDGESFHDWD